PGHRPRPADRGCRSPGRGPTDAAGARLFAGCGPRRPPAVKQDASTNAALEGCMGQHVQTQPNPVELHWQYAYGQIRVMDETCWRCAPLSYELGLLGGYYVIRRT